MIIHHEKVVLIQGCRDVSIYRNPSTCCTVSTISKQNQNDHLIRCLKILWWNTAPLLFINLGKIMNSMQIIKCCGKYLKRKSLQILCSGARPPWTLWSGLGHSHQLYCPASQSPALVLALAVNKTMSQLVPTLYVPSSQSAGLTYSEPSLYYQVETRLSILS